MLVLLDHGTPRRVASYLTGHTITKAIEKGWDRLTNGALLAAAEEAGFDVLVTTDKNMRYQQNLEGHTIAIVVLGQQQWPKLRPYVQRVAEAVNAAMPGSFIEVDIPRPPCRGFEPEEFQP